LADEIDQIQRAVEHCERRNQHEVKEEIRIFTQRYFLDTQTFLDTKHLDTNQFLDTKH